MLIYLIFLLKYIKMNLYIFKMYSCDGNVEFLQYHMILQKSF